MSRWQSLRLVLCVITALAVSAIPGFSQTPGTATFRVATVTANGNYAPRHVLAIWVTDSQTNFIKTLKRQAANRSQYLYQWHTRSGTYTNVDGVTGATLTSHQTHTVSWDCRNTNGVVMPDGQYRFYVEFTEANAQGPWTATNWVGFTKSSAFVTSNIPNLPNFTSLQIVFTPQAIPPAEHDLAVAAIAAPLHVVPGSVAAITVVATNLGNRAETFNVSLSNETQGVSLGTRSVGPVAAGGATNVTFTWATVRLPLGLYRLRATAGPATGETNLADNARTVLTAIAPGVTTNVAIGAGAVWRYQDEGLALHETPWRQEAYYDAAWPAGAAPLGFGNGGEATAIGRTNATAYFFRSQFSLTSRPVAARARIVRDDGAILYLNGTEAWRDNMPPGDPSSSTPAVVALAGAAETNSIDVDLDAELLHAGINTFAAEVHQAGGATAMQPWINELHYDNSGTDANEGVEIAGTAGADLSSLSLVFYDGDTRTVYNTVALTGTLDAEADGAAGAVWFAVSGIQNGGPDGVALVQNGATVLQFLSYEGAFTALDGPAAGRVSTDVGVSEVSLASGNSLQVTGVGRGAADFAWVAPRTHSRGTLNAGQTVLGSENRDLAFDLRLTTLTPQLGAASVPMIVDAAAPGDVLSGDTAPISITVSNSGTAGGSFRIVLVDTNSQQTIGTQDVAWLDPGSLETVTIDWATLGVATGTHGLQVYVVVNGVTNVVGGVVVDAVISGSGVRAAVDDAQGSVGGFCRAVAVDAGRAAVGEGATLSLLDLAGGARLGRVRLPGRIEDLAMSGPLVAAACGDRGVQLVEVGDPDHLALRSIYDTSGHAGAVAFGGGFLVVADGRSGLRVLDVQDVSAPVVIGACSTPGPVRAVVWATNRLYALDEHAGLLIYDMADPTTPRLLGSAAVVAVGRGLAVAGSYAYVADELGAFSVLDVTDAEAPVLMGRTLLAAAGGAVALRGSLAYVALGSAGIQPVEVSVPTAPVARAAVATAGDVSDLALHAPDTLLAADGFAGLRLLNLAVPDLPALDMVYADGARVADAATLGSLALLACGENGFRVYRLTNGADPELLSVSMLASHARALAVSGAIAYVADGEYGLKAFSITNPSAPSLLGTYAATGLVALTRVAAHGTDVAVTDGERIDLVDASDPAAMSLRARYADGHRIFDLAWLGSDLALAGGTEGVRILNQSGAVLGTYRDGEPAVAIEAADPYLYVANDRRGWLVLEATNHFAPRLVRLVTSDGAVQDVAVSGAQVVLAGDATVRAVDASLPMVPISTPAFSSMAASRRVAVAAGFLLAAEDEAGLGVFGSASPDTDADGMADAWEQRIVDADPLDSIHTLADVLPGADFDGDGMSNEDEVLAGTDPVDGDSRLTMFSVQPGGSGVTLRWFSALGRTYSVQRTTNLRDGFTPLATGIPATPPVNSFVTPTDAGTTVFYLVVSE